MKVSVVVPAYNEEKYLGACLDSLMRQTVKPDEIIVVNNNSTDTTTEIAQKYPVRLVLEEEQGMIPSRNRGFNEARYDIIAQTDADTILPPTWIKSIKSRFLRNPNLVALSGPARFYDIPEDIPSPKRAAKLYFNLFNKTLHRILKHDVIFGPNKAIRKSAWEKIKNEVCLDDEEVHEDIDLSIHISQFGEVKFDHRLIVNTSFRRFKKLEPYFEYPYRAVKSIRKHRHLVPDSKAVKIVKKIVSRVVS